MGGGKGSSPAPTVLPAPPVEDAGPVTPEWAMPGYGSKSGRGTKAKAKMAEEERVLNTSLAKIDDLWGKRMTAEEQSIASIDAEIAKEQQDANVLGVDYSIADEDRLRRIQAAFGNVWTDTQEASLFSLAKKYGNPEQTESERELIRKGERRYEWEYDISPAGSSPAAEPDTVTSSVGPVAASARRSNKTVLTAKSDDKDEKLGSKSILGG